MTRLRLFFFAVLILIAARASAAGARSLVLTGSVTNTTYDLTAPARIELTIDGDTLTGWLQSEPPLPGRYPVNGSTTGAWCELVGKPTPETTLQFRGLLSAADYRGTYIFGGKGERVQYGRFHFKPSTTPAPAAPPAP